MKKIVFLHGFFASGSCAPAQTIKEALVGKVEALTPDIWSTWGLNVSH